MALSWIRSNPIREALNSALCDYEKGVQQEEVGKHRDGYLWYLRSKDKLLEIGTEQGPQLNKDCSATVKKTIEIINARLPFCAALAAEEIMKIKNRLIHHHKKGNLPSFVLSQQDIITNFDMQMFIAPLSKDEKALIPNMDAEIEYTDESSDEEASRNTDVESLRERCARRKRRNAKKGSAFSRHDKVPHPSEGRRPKRPRVLTKKFQTMMSDPQPWDSVKHMVYKKLLNVKWSDIIGYEDAKQLLHTSIVLECEMQEEESSDMTSSCTRHNRTVLLYGPPGTGKSQLADAVATEAASNVFIKATGAALMSKYLGESEKNLTLLFEMAHDLSPAIIFFDECDAVFASRDSNDSQSTVNIAATLLTLMSTYRNINIIATTNLPWNLDPAFIRRFNKRCLLDLPTPKEREVMLKYCLRTIFIALTEDDYTKLASKLEGYSGSDIDDLNVTIFDILKEQMAKATHFKFCPFRPQKVIPCLSSDNDPSVTKARYRCYRFYDLERPLLKYPEVKAIIETYGEKTVDPKVIENLREYKKNPSVGDPAKRKVNSQQYVYRNYPGQVQRK